MNSTYQVILVSLIVVLAVAYLVWMAKKSTSKGCGGGCDCHHKNASTDDDHKH